MATLSVSDSVPVSDSVSIASFQRSLNESIVVSNYTNVQVDTGFLKLYFNNDNLNDIPNIQINGIEMYDQASRSLETYPIARGDGLKLVNAQYGLKTVVVDGFIAAATRALLETARDVLLKMIEPQEANLRFSQAGADRNYTCTLSNVIWTEKPGGGFTSFSLQFACSDPYGYDTSATTDLNAMSITTTASTQSFTAVGGTFKALPTFTVTVTSGTGLTAANINLRDRSGNIISINRTWVAGDILVVNCATKAVTVNGASVDYSGVFPVLQVGDTGVSYSDGFTTRSITLSMTHKNRFK